MSLTVEYATDPIWDNEEHTEINLNVKFVEFESAVEFTASPDDQYTTYGPELFANAAAGDYGPIAPYVPPPPNVGPSSLPPAITGGVYSTNFTASNGEPPYTFSVNSADLPPGLSLSGNTLSGVPSSTSAGTYSFKVTVVDNNEQTGNVISSMIVYEAGNSNSSTS